MSLVEPLFGLGRVFAQGRFLALVEYALIMTVVGHFNELAGSIVVLEGIRELVRHDGLKLQLSDGRTTPIAISSTNGSNGTYQVTGTYQA